MKWGIWCLIAVLMLASASAIEMRRTETFSNGQELTYDFLGTDYTIRVLKVLSGEGGKVEIKTNNLEGIVTPTQPFFYNELKVSLTDINVMNATLFMVWTKEDTPADAVRVLNENLKSTVEINDRLFHFFVEDVDLANRDATFVINEEYVFLKEGDKKETESGIVKLNRVIDSARAEISFWAKEGAGEEIVEEEEKEVEGISDEIENFKFTLTEKQKKEFSAFKMNYELIALNITKNVTEYAILSLNDEVFEMEVQEEKTIGDVTILVKYMNPDNFPATIGLNIQIIKPFIPEPEPEVEEVVEIEEETEEPIIEEEEEVIEETVEEVVEIEPEVKEPVEEETKEEKSPIGGPIKRFFRGIGNFFKWLF